MATFMLTYAYVPDMERRRQTYRAAHLANLEAAHDRGFLKFAGAFTDPVDGAILLFEADNAGQVFEWIATDPYNHDGLIRTATVRELTVAIGR
jgi:uncharacterized protein YciI